MVDCQHRKNHDVLIAAALSLIQWNKSQGFSLLWITTRVRAEAAGGYDNGATFSRHGPSAHVCRRRTSGFVSVRMMLREGHGPKDGLVAVIRTRSGCESDCAIGNMLDMQRLD